MVNPSGDAWGLWAASVLVLATGRWYIQNPQRRCFTPSNPCAQRCERAAFVATQLAALCTAVALTLHSFPAFWALVPVTVSLPLLFNVLQAPLSDKHDCWSRTSASCATFVEAGDDSDMDSDSDDDGENAVVVPAHASVATQALGIGDDGGSDTAPVADRSEDPVSAMGFAATPPNSTRSTSRSQSGGDGRGRADSAHWIAPGSQRSRAATLIAQLSSEKEVLEAQLVERERTLSRVAELKQQKAELEAKLAELETSSGGNDERDGDGTGAAPAALTVTKESASV